MNRDMLLIISDKHLSLFVDRFETLECVIIEIDSYKDYDEYYSYHKFLDNRYLLTREEWEKLHKWLKE